MLAAGSSQEADDYHRLGHQDIFIAVIDTSSLQPDAVDTLVGLHHTVTLPTQLSINDGVRYFDIKVLQHELSVRPRDNRMTEWLALDLIPQYDIEQTTSWPMVIADNNTFDGPVTLSGASRMSAPLSSVAYCNGDGASDVDVATASNNDVPASASTLTNGHASSSEITNHIANSAPTTDTSRPPNPHSGHPTNSTMIINGTDNSSSSIIPQVVRLGHTNLSGYMGYLQENIGVDTESSGNEDVPSLMSDSGSIVIVNHTNGLSEGEDSGSVVMVGNTNGSNGREDSRERENDWLQ
ncbi:MAG: hypothetical protein Q9220_003032 [cf. Caloplaca sp. 1 TL-2023]